MKSNEENEDIENAQENNNNDNTDVKSDRGSGLDNAAKPLEQLPKNTPASAKGGLGRVQNALEAEQEAQPPLPSESDEGIFAFDPLMGMQVGSVGEI